MNKAKFEDMVAMLKASDFLKKQEELEEEKKSHALLWVFAIIGAVVAIAGIAYAVYLYFTPDYLEDFEDEFEDDFDDDFFEEEMIEEAKKRNAEQAEDFDEDLDE